jgi:glutamate racemase
VHNKTIHSLFTPEESFMHHPQAPIGIYDSGLGGLSLVKALSSELPQESLLYVADTARVPYGGRNPAEIRQFSHEIIDYLVDQGVKMIAVACNTSSVMILPALKKYQGVPILGLAQAGARLPAGIKRVALLATEATVRSQEYKRMLQFNHPLVALTELPCPDFVPLVESGQWQSPEALQTIQQRLAPLKSHALDAVILGCSHFPYLAPIIQSVLGAGVRLLDPAQELAKQIQQALTQMRLLNTDPQPYLHAYTTACPNSFRPLAERYLQRDLRHLRQSNLGGRLLPSPEALQVQAVLV